MKVKDYVKGNLQTLAIIAGIVLFIYFMFKIKILLLFIFVAMAVSLICRPIVVVLTNKLRFSNTLAAFTTLVFMIAVVALMLWMFVPIILEQGQIVSEIDLDLVRRDLNELSVQASEYLGVEQIDLVETIKNTEFMNNVNKEFLSHFSDFFVVHGADIMAGIFAVLFISFFILKDDQLLIRAVTAFAEKKNERRFMLVIFKSRVLLSRYFLGLTLQTLTISLLYFFLLFSMDIENALAIALVCGFLNVVPYLGPLIGGAAMALIVLANNLAADFSTELLPKFVIIAVGVAIVQLLDNLVFQPVIFGKSVKSHPLEIFIAIVIFGLLFGIFGMILAIPVYTTVKVISKEFLSEYKFVKRLTENI
ncbi:AI-2E family transporter [Winogradskyella maritima]|uniref:AI-2E family transporter n=1 Tax=Winogradskyella maritima TaxID=1517766 RepID=A0ABV8AI32_9FLAO|nr:AI-2E family transporter [Winogradskyella maritima]